MSRTPAGPFLDHIDLRVRSLESAVPFYDAFMGALGMRRLTDAWTDWVGYAFEDVGEGDPLPIPFFGLTLSPGHRPGETRLAFAATSQAEVERIAEAVRQAGAQAFEAPQFCTEYDPRYYAAFFEDPDGNRFEICCRSATPA